jgi:hypothetical protein
MSIVLEIIDQVLGAGTKRGPQLSFKVGTITARDIIRARVALEVERYNSATEVEAACLVDLVAPPPAVELELNGPNRERRQRRKLDAGTQIEVALEAVRRGRVVILFNGIQVRDLDEALIVSPVSEARFLKLVPLVGG